jgi:hypothetical protein
MLREPPELTASLVNMSWMEPQVAGALAGAAAGAGAGGLARFIFDRRAEHARARSIARLLYRELEDIKTYVDGAREEGQPWGGADFEVRTWNDHGYVIAGELADGELITMAAAIRWVGTANHWRANFSSRGHWRFGRPAKPSVYSDDDARTLWLVSQILTLACQAIDPLQRGRRFFIFRRRLSRPLSPPLDSPCTCGHAFGDHEWRSRRRWLRFHAPRASRQDIGYGCKHCGCRRFRLDERGRLKPLIRRARLLSPVPKMT